MYHFRKLLYQEILQPNFYSEHRNHLDLFFTFFKTIYQINRNMWLIRHRRLSEKFKQWYFTKYWIEIAKNKLIPYSISVFFSGLHTWPWNSNVLYSLRNNILPPSYAPPHARVWRSYSWFQLLFNFVWILLYGDALSRVS